MVEVSSLGSTLGLSLQSFTRSPSVVGRAVARDVILVTVQMGVSDQIAVYTLNPTAARVWNQLGVSEPIPFENLVRGVVDRFEVELAVARQDVLALLRELVDAGLVVASDREGR